MSLAAWLAMGVASGAVIVDFDLDGRIPSTSDNTVILTDTVYSLSTAMLNASSFTGAGVTAPGSATLYGGSAVVGVADVRTYDGTPDYLRIGPGSQGDYDFAAVWRKADFLNNGATSQVDITSDSRLTITAAKASAAASGDPSYRWLLVQGTTTYASQLLTGLGTSSATLSSGNLTSLSWYTVDFASDFSGLGTIVSNPVTAGLYDDLDGVGVYFTSSASTDGTAYGTYLTAFEATLDVVPEPGTLALVLVGSLAVLTWRTRCRRKSATRSL